MDNSIMTWDDVIENDGQEYILLPEGDYTFVVTGFERGQFPGGQRLSACHRPCRGPIVCIERGQPLTSVAAFGNAEHVKSVGINLGIA